MSMTAPAPRHVFEVFTLGFLVQDGRVLLLERRKPPNAGRWNAPGGKLEAGEDPIQGIVREFAEETGLTLEDPTLRAVLCFHELDGAWRPQMIYTFLARRATGSLLASEEGRLAWWPVEQVLHDPRVVGNIPLFLPRMLAAGPPFVFIAAYRGERLEGYRVAPLLAGSDDGRAGSSDFCAGSDDGRPGSSDGCACSDDGRAGPSDGSAASSAGRPASGDRMPAPGPGAPPHA